MDNDKKHIDKLFKDYLAGHQAQTPDHAWERLNSALTPPVKKRPIFLYVKLAAASLLLLIAFGAGYFLSEHGRTDSSEVLSEATQTNTEIETIGSDDIDDTNFEEPKQPADEQKKIRIESAEISPMRNPQANDATQSSVVQTKTEGRLRGLRIYRLNRLDTDGIKNTGDFYASDIAGTSGREYFKGPIVPAVMIKDADQLAMESMTADELHTLLIGDDPLGLSDSPNNGQTLAQSNWSVGGQVSPVYSFRTLSGDAIYTPDEEVPKDHLDNAESGIVTIAGGINLNYNINNRLSLSSGLYLSRVGQENNDVVAYDAPGGENLYKLATSGGTVVINPTSFATVMIQQIDSSKDSIPGDYTINGTFVQNLDYLEVPLMMKYKVFDKKFSVNLMGGLSPGILVNNRSYFSQDGNKVETGTIENIKPMIYNSVVGLGLQYLVSKKLSIGVEPVFKYSLTPVNSGSSLDYHPYSFSFFTGITYKL